MFGTSGRGLPETMNFILMSFLVIVIVLLVAGMLTGFAGLLHQTPLVAVRGSISATPTGAATLILFHSGGATVTLNPAYRGDGPPPVKFTIRSGSNPAVPVGLSETTVNQSWSPGSAVSIYLDGKGYWVTDNIPARLSRTASLGPVIDMPHDETLTVLILDVKTNSTVASIAFVPGSGHP